MELNDYILFFIIYGLDYMISITLSFIFMQYYVKPNINKIVKFYCYFLLFGNFLLIFTLPYEIIWRKLLIIYKKRDLNVVGMEYILGINYKIIFFFIASCSRYLNPFIKHYLQSGEFTVKRKLWDAFKKGLIEFLLFNIIILLLVAFLQNVVMALFIAFSILSVMYTLIFLSHSMVTIPKNMIIQSDINISIEFYEYKANKKHMELTKNHEKIISTYYQCQKTFEYIQNIEDYLKDGKINIDKNEHLEEEKEENITEKKEKLEENNNDIKEEENKIEENLIDKENEQNTKNPEKEKLNMEKDYKKHKAIVKYKTYLNMLSQFIEDLIKKYNINLEEKKDEKSFKDYKNIVEANFEMKMTDIEIERITEQILQIYNGWALKKGVLSEMYKINEIQKKVSEDNNGEFIPPSNIPMKKIQFFKKYNTIIYKSLMILTIIIDLLIIIQEFSLCLPVNISIFSLIFKNVNNQISVHFLFIFIAGLLYSFTAYSFSKIKSFGIKYMIFGGGQTNALALFMFCHRLSTISYPIAMNIILMIFYTNISEEENGTSIIEQNYGTIIGSTVYYIISFFIPIALIILMILDYFHVLGRICKKKKIKQSYFLKNEIRDNKIVNGRAYLMKLNKENLGTIENII